MRILIACASALWLTVACGTSQNAAAALKAMNLAEGNTSKTITYKSRSGAGDKVTLSDVRLGEASAPDEIMLAKTVELGGLDVTKDGKPVVKLIVIKGITPEKAPSDGSKIAIDSIGIEGMNPATGEYVAAMFSDPASTAAAPAFDQWQFSKVSLNGLNFSIKDGDAASTGGFNAQLGEFSLSDLKNSVIGNAKFAGFKGNFDIKGDQPVKGSFDLGTTEIKNIHGNIYASISEAMLASLFNPGGGAQLSDSIGKALTSPLEPGFDSLTASGMNVEASGLKFTVSKIEEKVTRDGNGVATALSVPRATMTFSANSAGGELGQKAAMGLSAAGYPSSTIELYTAGSATFDPAKDLTRYANYQVGVTDGLDVQLSAGVAGLHKAIPQMIGGMTTSMMQMLPALMAMQDQQPGADGQSGAPNMDAAAAGMVLSMMSSMMEVKITDLDLSITDKSLVGFLMAQAAKDTKQPLDNYRQDLANMISSSAQDLGKSMDPAMAKELTTALAGFVRRPGTLHVVLKPKEPLGLETFMGGSTPITRDQLGMTATFTPGASK